jgi:putative drug exporter of the RND superfamily
MSKIAAGQLARKQSLTQLQKGLSQFSDGLNKSDNALKTVSTGLDTAVGYFDELSTKGSKDTMFIPQKELSGKAFARSLDTYLSQDRKLVKLNVELSVDPYSKEAMEIVRNLDKIVENNVKGTSLKNAVIGIGGISSQNRDLDDVATGDFTTTRLIMLLGILLVLLVITKSVLTSGYIIVSLLAAYFAALSMTDLIFNKLLDYAGLGWNVPFFSFIMIIALGVDYSIFMITRYQEYRKTGEVEAIVIAAKKVGGVVISAAVILAGTFAAMYSSGVEALLQIATTVIIGIVLLSLLMLPLFIPAMVALINKRPK